jgi:hypothetical protein
MEQVERLPGGAAASHRDLVAAAASLFREKADQKGIELALR